MEMKIIRIDKAYLRNNCKDNNKFVEATFEITTNCNFKCRHCYNDVHFPDASFDSISATIEKLVDMGVIYITLTGGEVFTRPDFELIYFTLKAKGFIISIFTNAALLNCVSNVILSNKPDLISVSLYGADEEDYMTITQEQGQYKRVIEALDSLFLNNIGFELKVIISKLNYAKIMQGKYDEVAKRYNKKIKYSYIIFASKSGKKDICDLRVTIDEIMIFISKRLSDSWMEKDYKMILKKSPEEHSCWGGESTINVDSASKISVCIKDMEYKIDSTVTAEKIIEMVKSRKQQIIDDSRSDFCNQCKINYGCTICSVEKKFNNDFDFMCSLQHRIVNELG